MPDVPTFTLVLRMPERDIDPQGHVNNVAFVRYVQEVAVAHWNNHAPADVRTAVRYVGRAEARDRILPARFAR